MTRTKLTSPSIKKTLLTLVAAAMLAPAAAFAGDAPAGLTVKSTTDGFVKMSVKAFKKGEFQRSADLSRRALKQGISVKRQAVVYGNLCAAEAALGNMEAAGEACAASLEMRPGYAVAEANKSTLTVMLAEK